MAPRRGKSSRRSTATAATIARRTGPSAPSASTDCSGTTTLAPSAATTSALLAVRTGALHLVPITARSPRVSAFAEETAMRKYIAFALIASACIVGDGSDDDYDESADGGDTGDDGGELEVIEAGTVDATRLNVGFNNGYADQFNYYPMFFASGVKPPARLCHAYVSWKV